VITLLNRISGQEELAEIASPIAMSDMDCYVGKWMPVFEGKIAELKSTSQFTREGAARHNVEDSHWQWPAKVKDRTGQLQWNSYALRCAGSTQGLMFVDMLRRCRLESQRNLHMVYIDLLATAPWNRQRLTPQPVYRGVGEALMLEAILQSSEEGFGGRIGLHALPGAESFYRDEWGMESLGVDPNYSDLHYFEMTTQQASELLSS
jgi:hypothetical protein